MRPLRGFREDRRDFLAKAAEFPHAMHAEAAEISIMIPKVKTYCTLFTWDSFLILLQVIPVGAVPLAYLHHVSSATDHVCGNR
jgi:hypothetical protein